MRDSNCVNVENVRADELRLNDVLLVTNWNDEPQLTRVLSLSLCGDDVEVNGNLTTSQGNLLTRLV